MRFAALAFGILAGLVASLILALGGLDAAADLGTADERQIQAVRFGLLVISNIGVFGAALALAAPLAAGILLALGAVAWVGAALATHHTTGLVLITPPALLLLAAALSFVAHWRRPQLQEDDPQIEIIAPEHATHDDDYEDEAVEDDVPAGMPSFASDPPRASVFDTRLSPHEDDWNPRRRQPPPPRAKAAFRDIDEEYDEEPSGLSQFAGALSSILSFGLYAALAGGALLLIWNMSRGGDNEPATIVAEAPPIMSEATSPVQTPAPIVSQQPPAAPILTAPQRQPSLPAASEAAPLPVVIPQTPQPSDGASRLPALPVLPDMGPQAPAQPPPVAEAIPEPEGEPAASIAASVPAAGQPFPHLLPAGIAALRSQPAPTPALIATPRQAVDNTGL